LATWEGDIWAQATYDEEMTCTLETNLAGRSNENVMVDIPTHTAIAFVAASARMIAATDEEDHLPNPGNLHQPSHVLTADHIP
jgi:hypothetical protein